MTAGGEGAGKPRPPQAWFERREVEPGVELICEPYVHPWFRCNIWLVRGRGRDLVVDAGMGLRSLTPALGLTPGKPVIAVATHVHVDHIGSLHEFDDRRAHAAEAAAYATMPDEATLAHLFRAEAEPVSAPPYEGWSPADFRLRPAPLRSTLAAGEEIDLGDRAFRLLHLPGHSPDSIGLFDEADGMLFSGDALYDGLLIDDFPRSSAPRYIETMQRLRELPIRIGHGGHGPCFDQARKAVLVEEYLAGKRLQGCPREAPALRAAP